MFSKEDFEKHLENLKKMYEEMDWFVCSGCKEEFSGLNQEGLCSSCEIKKFQPEPEIDWKMEKHNRIKKEIEKL